MQADQVGEPKTPLMVRVPKKWWNNNKVGNNINAEISTLKSSSSPSPASATLPRAAAKRLSSFGFGSQGLETV